MLFLHTLVPMMPHYLVQRCGFSGLRDVESKALNDRMDSFFLSETTKYLYLLFDDDSFIHSGSYVFNTGVVASRSFFLLLLLCLPQCTPALLLTLSRGVHTFPVSRRGPPSARVSTLAGGCRIRGS